MTGQQRGGSPSRGANKLVTRLEPVVRRTVEGVGFALEELDVQQAGRRRLVKVVIDVADPYPGPGSRASGVELDEIAEVSRAVSASLDAEDELLAGAYTLEVTSPGVDRPLTEPRHWQRARLRLVTITLTDGATLTARVGRADGSAHGGVEVLREGALRTIPYAEIDHAVVEVEFREPPAAEVRLLDGSAGDTAGTRSETGIQKEES